MTAARPRPCFVLPGETWGEARPRPPGARAGRGRLPDRVLNAWPVDCHGKRRKTPDAVTAFGCYPLYYVDRGGFTLCADCAARAAGDSDFRKRPADVATNDEDPDLTCDDCAVRIPPACGDD